MQNVNCKQFAHGGGEGGGKQETCESNPPFTTNFHQGITMTTVKFPADSNQERNVFQCSVVIIMLYVLNVSQ